MNQDPKKKNQNNQNNDSSNNDDDRRGKRIILLVVAALVAVLLINSLYASISNAYLTEIRYDEFLDMVDSGEIYSVEFQSDRVVITPTSEADKPIGKQKLYYTGLLPNQDTTELADELRARGAQFQVKIVEEMSPIVSFLISWVIPVAVMYLLFSLLMRSMTKKMGGGGIGGFGIGENKAKVYMEKSTGVTFADVAGQDEAKAVAGEANVPFFSISGSDFVEMFVGVGASRVRSLFQEANKVAPAIIFIDEIDAIGRTRDSKFGGNDEREQTLNQLLAEIDGFDSSKGVVILAATNRPEILDKALLRAGRFDRRIIVDRPNLQGRYQTLRVHTRNIKLSEDVDLHKLAQVTAGAVGADLANLVNEAALRAVRQGRKTVNQQDLLASFETVIAGTEKKGTVLTDMEKRIVSYHEVGHALVAALQKHTQPVSKITIVPHTSGALGYTMQMPEEEKFLSSKEELIVELQTLLGGRAAEQTVFGIQTTGASNDIERATDLARKMVTQYGMSDKFGLMALSSVSNPYLDGSTMMNCADSTASAADEEIQSLLAKCYADAKKILAAHRSLLDEIALYLLQKETITGDELMAYINADKAKLPETTGACADADAQPASDTSASDSVENSAQPDASAQSN